MLYPFYLLDFILSAYVIILLLLPVILDFLNIFIFSFLFSFLLCSLFLFLRGPIVCFRSRSFRYSRTVYVYLISTLRWAVHFPWRWGSCRSAFLRSRSTQCGSRFFPISMPRWCDGRLASEVKAMATVVRVWLSYRQLGDAYSICSVRIICVLRTAASGVVRKLMARLDCSHCLRCDLFAS